MNHLKDKVAIVTGAGQGVGRGIASALAKAGASVAVVGRSVENTRMVAKELVAQGLRAEPFICDVKDSVAIVAMVEKVVATFGGVDILVNNAQEVTLGTLLEIEDSAFLAGFESGPLATLRLMKVCHPHLARSREGVIINLASASGIRWDMAGYGAYGAVKQAIRVLTRAAAAEWAQDGIRALNIAPYADSPALKDWIESRPDESSAFFEATPLRRIGRCEEDIGVAVAALCAPAFSYMTGVTIPLDGGMANFD